MVGLVSYVIAWINGSKASFQDATMQHLPVPCMWILVLSFSGFYLDVALLRCTGIQDTYIMMQWGIFFAGMGISLLSHQAYGSIMFMASLGTFLTAGIASAIGPPNSMVSGAGRGDLVQTSDERERTPDVFLILGEGWGTCLVVGGFILAYLPTLYAVRNKVVQNCYRSMLCYSYMGGYSHEERVLLFDSNFPVPLVRRVINRLYNMFYAIVVEFDFSTAFFPCDHTTFDDLATYSGKVPIYISQLASHLHFNDEQRTHFRTSTALTDGSVN